MVVCFHGVSLQYFNKNAWLPYEKEKSRISYFQAARLDWN